jgi:hypothetical protein
MKKRFFWASAIVILIVFMTGCDFFKPAIEVKLVRKMTIPSGQIPLRVSDQCDNQYVCDADFIGDFSSIPPDASKVSLVGVAFVANNVPERACPEPNPDNFHEAVRCNESFKRRYYWSDREIIKALGDEDEVSMTLREFFSLRK